MKQQISVDWIINNGNIFGLHKEAELSFFTIQVEILNQIKDIEINSLSDYFQIKADVINEIRGTQSLTIQKVFKNFLDTESLIPKELKELKCGLVLSYLQLILLKEYCAGNNKNILPITEYKEQYCQFLEKYLSSNIDTDEQGFIKAELTLCNDLVKELNKPIYNEILFFKAVSNEPCKFKKNIINSIDKRKKYLETKENELPIKIKALFQFVEYLHSNIENFKQYSNLIKELELLRIEKQKLKPEKNYKNKLRYNELQGELESKFKLLQDNTANLIKAKAKELEVCSFDKEPIFSWFGIESDIQQLKQNFSIKDLPQIFKYKNQYIKYRTNTHKTFLSLEFFFDELDEITKSLFDYFKETEEDEFEPFETKSVEVVSVREAVKELAEKNSKPLKVNITGFNIEKGEGNTFKNMPVIENHYLPLIDNLKKAIISNEIPTKDIVFHWQKLRNEIESDLYSIGKMYNDETIEFCKKRIFPLIDNEIRKTEQIIPPQPIKTKADILKENLQKGGFYNLEKVVRLSEAGQRGLIKLLSENKMPYGIAMFDYLRFCAFLDKEKETKVKANIYLSRLYNEKAKDGTRSRHLRNSLINNKPRHTSYLHIESTIKDYEKLK